MASNEDRAKLLGWGEHTTTAISGLLKTPDGHVYFVPSYDTSLDAVAELLRFVRKRGKMREFCGHILQIVAPALNIGAFPVERIFDLLDATPAQQTAAFDAVFADELSRIE